MKIPIGERKNSLEIQDNAWVTDPVPRTLFLCLSESFPMMKSEMRVRNELNVMIIPRERIVFRVIKIKRGHKIPPLMFNAPLVM